MSGRPVYLVDERLTSREAKNQAGQKIRRIEQLDAIAATLILETWLSDS